MHLELGLVKLVQAGRLQSIEEALSGMPSAPRTQPPRSVVATVSSPAAPPPARFTAPPPIKRAPEPAPEPPASTGDLHHDLSLALRAAKLEFSADALQQATVELKGPDLIIRAPKGRMLALKDAAVAAAATKLLGRPVRIKLEVDESIVAAAVAAPKPEVSSSDLRDRALAHPGVKRLQELFPDAQIRTVRNLNE